MSEEDLVSNSDEVNMKTFKIIHPDVPGYISIVAESDDDVEAIFHDWFSARFGRTPERFMVEDVSASLKIANQLHHAAHASALPGVAYAVEEHGWIVLPADMEAPGPYHLSGKGVVCYEFAQEKDGCSTTILAQDPGHAWHIYRVWAKHHGCGDDIESHADLRQANSPLLKDPRISKAIRLGIAGVVSRRPSGWDVLPPWDECAGDN